jgi:hypothetical protein
MALIIEDGTNVADADSFATVAEARTYAASRGLTLPVADADVEILLRKALDYLMSLEDRFQGYRVNDIQELCFPRDEIYLFRDSISGEIPKILKNGQIQLAIDANTNDLLAPGTGKEVIEKKVGPLTTKYSPNGATSPQFRPTAALAILQPLFRASNGFNLLAYK